MHIRANFATIESGTALASGYSTIGTVNAGTATGVHTADIFATARYLRSTITSTGGSAIVTADVIAKPITITA